MPLIVDTDLGGDPDDAVALVVASGLPELALVVTCDEYDGRRAKFARHLLDLLGRPDVPVVAGRDLGNSRYWCVDDLVPADVPDQSTDVAAAVERVCAGTPGRVRWLGIGPMSNLADLITGRQHLASRFTVTLMGGGLAYRHPDRAEHNVRLDIPAARVVLEASMRPRVMPSDVTFTPANEITADSELYRRLAVPEAPAWAKVLVQHLDNWFASFHPGTMQHDALALALAMGQPFVDIDLVKVALDAIGRMVEDPDGSEVFLARAADYSVFHNWLDRLTETSSARA
ncbi:nucleoside hydrolase [Actinopolymorpha pittospori]